MEPESNPHARSTVAIRSLRIGPDAFVVAAGPCAVESREQLLTIAGSVAEAGAAVLRGGAFKPRTSPHTFQGLGAAGLALLSEASRATGLPVVTELLDPRDAELVARHADIVQVGSRSMQNYPLLREVGRLSLPVLLKRGAAATIDELLAAADHVAAAGNERIVLCERGIRTFDPGVRYTLDLAAVPRLRARTALPIFVDPSHATGARALVGPMALAALAAGADGVLVEVHHEPAAALCDGPQALLPADFRALMSDLRRWVPLTGRRLAGLSTSDRREAAVHASTS
jgi:3-deoxy-7-phosphoheptulonate synthase